MGVSKSNLLRNFVAGLLASYGAIAFVSFMTLSHIWTKAAPSEPNEALGMIYRHNEHGSYTYYSAFQATACALLFWTSIWPCFLAAAVMPKRNFKSAAGCLSVGATWELDDPKGIFSGAIVLGVLITLLTVVYVGPLLVTSLNDSGFVLEVG